MDELDLEASKESLARVVDLVRTAEDISGADLSQIVFSTLVDQVGEDTAEKVLAAYSGELADFIFQHEVIDIPDSLPSDSLGRVKIELEEFVVQNTHRSLPDASNEKSE